MFKHEIIYLLSLFWLLLKNVLFQIVSYVIESFMKVTEAPKLIHCQHSASCDVSLSFSLCIHTTHTQTHTLRVFSEPFERKLHPS